MNLHKVDIKVSYELGTENIDWVDLKNLYYTIGMEEGLDYVWDIDELIRSFEGSYKVVTAYDGDKLVGASRMISDGVCYGTIYDVGVLPKYQHQGIGTRMVEYLLEGNLNMIINLASVCGKDEFYKRLGFEEQRNSYVMFVGEGVNLR